MTGFGAVSLGETMRDAQTSAYNAPGSQPGARERWVMSVEARSMVVVTAVLLVFGLAVLYSASALVAIDSGKPGGHFLIRQLTGAVAGALVFAVAAKVDAERWRGWAWPIMGASLFLMLITVLPFTKSIAPSIGGSRRFLLGGSFQPSEFAKLAVILWTPMLLVKKGESVRRLGKGLAPFLLVIGFLSLLALLEPDLSIAMTFCLLMALLLFVGGARVAHFVFLGLLCVPLALQQLASKPYVRARLESFFATDSTGANGDKPASPVSDQQRQSLIAVGSGRAVGVGFGEGNQQRGWTPLAYNDFIASVVGEEFGFVGMSLLVVAFAAYGWLGFRIARNARTPFCSLVAIGLTFTTVFTAFVHVGVSIGLLPNTGLTLPFVSYGRSNLVLTMLMTGILVNIGSSRERVYGTSATDPLQSLPT